MRLVSFVVAQREWWQVEAARTDLLLALDHFNAALTSVEQRPGWQVDACTDVFWGLNKLWELREGRLGPYATDGGRRATDLRQFKELARGVSVEWADWLLRCDELQRLAHFRPMILDHAAAGMNQSPLIELPDDVIERASRAHAEFDRKLDSFRGGRARSSDGALAELAYLLSIVRNNLMHGEKSALALTLSERDATMKLPTWSSPLRGNSLTRSWIGRAASWSPTGLSAQGRQIMHSLT